MYELLTLVDGCGEVFASHTIGEESVCLITELDKTDIINHYIEVSVDNDILKRVFDYSNYKCISWQFLYFFFWLQNL